MEYKGTRPHGCALGLVPLYIHKALGAMLVCITYHSAGTLFIVVVFLHEKK